MKIHDKLIILVSVFLCMIPSSTQDEESTQSLEIKLYRLELGEWNDNDHFTKLQDLLASESNNYCSSKPEDCGLSYWNNTFSFIRSDVMIANGYPIKEADLTVRFHVLANFSSSLRFGHILNIKTTTSVLLAIKDRLETAVGTYVTYVGDEFYGIPPDDLANRIMIPIAFTVLAIIVIVTVALSIWNKKKEKDRQKQQLKKIRQVSTKISSTMQTSTNGNTVKKPEVSNLRPNSENNLMKDNTNNPEEKHMESKHMSPVTNNNSSRPSLNEFVDDASSYTLNDAKHKPNELPPITAEDTDQESRIERHRKKKKSKKKKKRDREAYENSGMDESETETLNHKITTVQSNNVIDEETVM